MGHPHSRRKAGRGRKSRGSSDDVRNPIKGLRRPAKERLRGLVEESERGDGREGERKRSPPVASHVRSDQADKKSQHAIRGKVEQFVGRDRRAGVKRHIQSRNMRGHDEYDRIGSRNETQTLGEESNVCQPFRRIVLIRGLALARRRSIGFRGAKARLCPTPIKARRAVCPPLEPWLQPLTTLRLVDPCGEKIPLPPEDRTKQMRQRSKRLYKQPREETVAKCCRRLRQVQGVAVAEAMPKMRRVSVDCFLNLPFGPAKNKVWDLRIVYTSADAAIAEDSRHFVRLRDTEKLNPPHQAAVSSLDKHHDFPGNAIHLQHNPVG